MTVADVLADGLARAGSPRVFTVSGAGGAGPLGDACARRGLAVTPIADASSACVMGAVAGGLRGAPGAVLITDALDDPSDGLAHALHACLPLVVLAAGPAALVKGTLTVAPESAAHSIAHACRLAMAEPWGPVWLDVPPGIATAAAAPIATSCRPSPSPPPDPEALDAAARLLGAAERPLVVVGPLCRTEGDGAWVRAFAEARPAPILATPGARGLVPDPHPLVIGVLDGGRAERDLLAAADLIVAIGLDPGAARATSWPALTPRLHLTPCAAPDAPDDRASARVAGDLALILEELAPRLRDRPLAEWDVARLHALKQAAAAEPISAQPAASRVVEAARRLTPAGTVAVFDGGAALAAAARAWQAVAPGECVVAAEGFAVAAAAAARLAHPERGVVCFTTAAALAMRESTLAAAQRALAAVSSGGLALPIVILGGPSPALVAPAALPRLAAPSAPDLDVALVRALAAGTATLVDARFARPTKRIDSPP